MTIRKSVRAPLKSGKGEGPYYVFVQPPPRTSFWNPFWSSLWHGITVVLSAVWHVLVVIAVVIWKIISWMADIMIIISMMAVINDILFGRKSRD